MIVGLLASNTSFGTVDFLPIIFWIAGVPGGKDVEKDASEYWSYRIKEGV